MTLFNRGKLPLMDAQKLQQRVHYGVKKFPKDNSLDSALAFRYQRGDEQAGIQLLENYLDIVSDIYRKPTHLRIKKKCSIDLRSISTKEDREDLFQEICTHFFGLALEFDPEVGNFQGLIKGKLHLRVYKYYFSEYIDTRKNETKLDDDFDMADAIREIFLEDSVVSEEVKTLYSAISTLPELQQKIIEMTVVKGWNSTEVSQEIGFTPAYIRKSKERTLRRLRETMEAA
ncbi:RNA polymerase sigma factor [Bacillus wiedmannii]|uniref:RNA polymerase sigma factor n=1 Tax=Bacillus wiedmannii TaxID=1890302 RepID=UPI000BF10C24|nr:sigma-70 family RNA polymerase sigma factor [Bacillus wiedmannii]PEM30177.1 RNA polymerase subunit sigma-70 [Bacillus wiedmannii]